MSLNTFPYFGTLCPVLSFLNFILFYFKKLLWEGDLRNDISIRYFWTLKTPHQCVAFLLFWLSCFHFFLSRIKIKLLLDVVYQVTSLLLGFPCFTKETGRFWKKALLSNEQSVKVFWQVPWTSKNDGLFWLKSSWVTGKKQMR